MNTAVTEMSPRTERFLRRIGWLSAAALLALPAIAMQFTEEVNWTTSDFVIAGVVLALVGGVFELAARSSTNLAFRIATVMAVACGFLQVWINGAVGIIGNEDNPANWTYFAVVFMAAVGAVAAYGNPRALVRTMIAVAVAQGLFSIIHAINGTPTPIIDGFFVLLWLVAAGLFRRAALQREAAIA
ncbi:hypothetical protein [Tsuneonella dongtanensis]|nr:hypothetical protein [Tsuneonella dongtanensis]